MGGAVFDGALFNLGDAARDRDDDPRFDAVTAVVHLADEIAQHRLGHFEIGDDAVLHGANGLDVTWCATQHPFRLFTYRQDMARPRLDRHHAGLSQNNAAITHVHQRVRGSQIDTNIGREIV